MQDWHSLPNLPKTTFKPKPKTIQVKGQDGREGTEKNSNNKNFRGKTDRKRASG